MTDLTERLRKYLGVGIGTEAANEIDRLRRIEAAAVACTESEVWAGDTFYNLMMGLQDALHHDNNGRGGKWVK
jgi:hypothetical protein